MAEVTLSLDTVRTRRKIAIDGTLYELLDMDDLSLAQTNLLNQAAKDLTEFGQPGKTEEELRQMEIRLQRVVAFAFVKPPEVLARLSDMQRVAIINAFCSAQRPPAPVGELEKEPAAA